MTKPLSFILFILVQLFVSIESIHSQEICDDGIDNDGDGLIDLNDEEDCICEIMIPSSLIPNPSFEEMTCCPTTESALHCANDWIQASAATTDYVHTCGTLGNNYLVGGQTGTGFYEAPLPMPEGEGAIGFRDGKPFSPNFKEYAGSYLLENMKVGVDYTLDFWVGFHTETSSRVFPMAIFATDIPNKLPFGNNNTNIGCPLNEAGWDQLGELIVSGNTEWVNVVFQFTPEKPYSTLVLGPGCAEHPDFEEEPYFFFDNLIIAESTEFGLPFADISGTPCENNLVIIADDQGLSYQWYLDGVAIIGESTSTIAIDIFSPEGTYEVLIETEEGCLLSEKYVLEFPEDQTMIEASICEGETYELGSQILDTSGDFTEVFSIGQCDSIVNLTLTVLDHTGYGFSELICGEETYDYNGVTYDESGIFDVKLKNANGCDSIVQLEILKFPHTEAFLDDSTCEGEPYEYEGQVFDETGLYDVTLTNANGCDSVVHLDFIVLKDTESYFSEEQCEGLPFDYEGNIFEEEGQYELTLANVQGCDSTIYLDFISLRNTEADYSQELCEGLPYEFEGQIFEEEGNFDVLLTNAQGCDSIVHLELIDYKHTESYYNDELCEGIPFEFEGQTFQQGGQYEVVLTNANGCDSIIYLELEEFQNVQEWSIEDTLFVKLGDYFSIEVNNPSGDIARHEWYENSVLVSEEAQLAEVLPLANTSYEVIVYTKDECYQQREVIVEIDRDIKIYTPNVITPNEPTERKFIVGANKAINQIKNLRIYDRWGELVYLYEGPIEDQPGWNGRFNDGLCEIGVYTYLVEALAIDGQSEFVAGTVLLLR